MKVYQKPKFIKQTKKLHQNILADLKNVITKIIADTSIGEVKKGDLADVYVYKFKFNSQEFLIAYIFDDSSITFLSFGTHENFYRDLKR